MHLCGIIISVVNKINMAKVEVIEDLTKEEIIARYSSMRDKLDQVSKEKDGLAKLLYDLQTEYNDLKLQKDKLQAELDAQKEKYRKNIAAKFQSQNNKCVVDQLSLFDDVEEEVLKTEQEECEYVEIEAHKRKKRVPKEKHIDYSNLERRVETLDIPEGEDICPVCGDKMVVKKYEEKEELVVVPAQVYVRVTRIPVLECVNCQSVNEDGKSTYSEVSHTFLFERSKCSPELLSYIINMKYSAGLPLYALEKHFKQLGVIIPRQNMCNWILKSAKYIEPLYNLMKEDMMSLPYVHADETYTQCLNEEGKPATSTSYMFAYHSPKWSKPIVLYDYRNSRSGDNPKEYLSGFKGYLTTDAYAGYNKVENVVRTFCNVHALRKFKDAYKLLPKGKERKTSEEAEAIRRYQKIFEVNTEIEERASKKYSDLDKRMEYITKARKTEIKPKFDEFLSWLEGIDGKIGRHTMSDAIHYVLNNREGLTRFIEDGRIDISNNITEQSIRPFVCIRNRCKFYVSTTGADTSAKIYSLMITCEQNGINPYTYLIHIFETLPGMDLTDKEALRKLLPYSEELPSYTKMMNRKEIKQILEEDKKSSKS